MLFTFIFFLTASAPSWNPNPAPKASLVISGTILKREEIWDRRSNPLMGVPDVLTEIRLDFLIKKVRRGRLPKGTGEIQVSIKGQKSILTFRSLREGATGRFFLGSVEGGYVLLDVRDLVLPPPVPTATPRPRNTSTPLPPRPFPEDLRARDVQASAELREKAVRAIADKYRMTEARAVFLTSFSGPMPPDGGYLYWGVTGKVKGTWQVWQAGYPSLRPGQELQDPQRYKK